MLSEKGGKNEHCLKHKGIYFRLSELLIQGGSRGMNEPEVLKPSLFILVNYSCNG